jgi:hypothetical protein
MDDDEMRMMMNGGPTVDSKAHTQTPDGHDWLPQGLSRLKIGCISATDCESEKKKGR